MKIFELLERIFTGKEATSRSHVKERLKLILAHDRMTLPPETLGMMRQEILAVVSKYVEVEEGGMEINLEMDQRSTALIASLPILRAKGPFPPATPLGESFIVDL